MISSGYEVQYQYVKYKETLCEGKFIVRMHESNLCANGLVG
jgi:hypothetical protein